MIHMEPVLIDSRTCIGIFVRLPQTNLLAISTPNGYIMCGLLAVERMDELHPEREVVAARVSGVATFEEMLVQKIDAVSQSAIRRGITIGMSGAEALKRMF